MTIIQYIYLITGASSDVGKAFIRDLDNLNEKVVVIGQYYSSKKQLEEISKNLTNISLDLVKCDLSNQGDVKRMINYIKEKYSSPSHILHLAANKFEFMRLTNLDLDRISNDMEIQVYSIAEILKAFLPAMSKKKFGKVVFMLSAYTLGVPPKFMTNYVMTKYALVGFMKSIAAEYSGKGISINGLSPNMIETKFLNNLDVRTIEMNAMNSNMKRSVEIEEVVSAIRYLMSQGSNYMNGVNLNMTGGDEM